MKTPPIRPSADLSGRPRTYPAVRGRTLLDAFGRYIVPLLTLGFLVVATAVAAQEPGPGNRPDSTPMFFSLERKIIGHALKLYEHREELARALADLQSEYDAAVNDLAEKREQAPSRGLPLVTDSRQDFEALIEETTEDYRDDRRGLEDKYGGRVEQQQTRLGNTLASPANDGLGERIELYRPYTASREQLELYNAALNLQLTANALTARLRADRADYALAVETYNTMLELLITVIEMNSAFAMRVDQHYKPEAHTLMARVRRAQARTETAQGVDPNVAERELEKLTTVLQRMQENLPKLDKMKVWAEANVTSLEPILNTIRLLKDNATVVRDAADWVGSIEESFVQLNVSLPPLVEYGLVESDFDIILPGDS